MKKDIEGISRIGFAEDYEIYIHTDDEICVPNFHIRNTDKENKVYASICIEKAEYCFHNSEEEKLNFQTTVELQKFMQSPAPVLNGRLTFWECLCVVWETNNASHKISAETMPDYTLLK